MIVLLVLRSVAFGALFVSPLEWQTKLFLGAALLLIELHCSLLDTQADQNSNEQQALIVAALKTLEQKLNSHEASSSVQSTIEELWRRQAFKESVFSFWTSAYLVFSGSVAISILLGWLLGRFVFSAAL